MNTGEEKFAQTEPFSEIDDTDKISQETGLEMNDGVGAAKNKLDDTKNKAEYKSESLIDSVKDFFE